MASNPTTGTAKKILYNGSEDVAVKYALRDIKNRDISNAIDSIQNKANLSGGNIFSGVQSFNGNASINTSGYISGTWLQATANLALGSAPNLYAVLNNGWIYSRTAAQTKEDLGINGKQDALGYTPENVVNKKGSIDTSSTIEYPNSKAVADFVNSSINAIAAFYITKNAAGDPFATKAELTSATTFYSGGAVRTPTKNDYCIVSSDESHDGNTSKYIYTTQWEFQYTFNYQFTQAQWNSINSGITSTSKVTHTASTAVGSTTKPVYVKSDGSVAETTYSLGKTVPSDAVFTDHITTATTSGSGNAVTAISADANGNLTVTKGTTFLTSNDIDSTLSTTSENAVQNKVINEALNNKLNTSGGNITGDINVITGEHSKFVRFKDTSSSDSWGYIRADGDESEITLQANSGIAIKSSSSPDVKRALLFTGNLTSTDKEFQFPDKSGIFALTDDIKNEIVILKDNGSTTEGNWLAKTDEITSLTEGQLFLYEVTVDGASTTQLTISFGDGTSAGPYTVYRRGTTKLTTQYVVGAHILLTYDSASSTAGFRVVNDYDADTTAPYYLRPHYFRPYTGTEPLYRYKFFALSKDNKVVPITVTNQTTTTQVAKVPTQVAFRPDKIYLYNTTATVAANTVMAADTFYSSGYVGSVGAYNFNTNIPAYRLVYLRGTYNKTTGLFTLYKDSSNPCTSYYTSIPTNTNNLTLSSYFVNGYYYILVGGTYSSTNNIQLFEHNPMYYFDGTNLIPWEQKGLNDKANLSGANFTGDVTIGSTVISSAQDGNISNQNELKLSSQGDIILASNNVYIEDQVGEKYTVATLDDIPEIGVSGGAAAYNHTHPLSMASSSASSDINLNANTKYTINAGGSSYVIKTPPSVYRAIKVNGTQFLGVDNSTPLDLVAGSNITLTTDTTNGTVTIASAGGETEGLPTTGGTMTGDIYFNTASSSGTRKGTYFRATTSDNSYGAILGDNATNKIGIFAQNGVAIMSSSGASLKEATLLSGNLTANRTFQFPDKSGTIAVTDDIKKAVKIIEWS